jgi:nucleotide-binding universal stress UspA family protein
MIKTILASLTGFGSDRTVLDAAIATAKIDKGHVQCLHTRLNSEEVVALVRASNPQRGSSFRIMQVIANEERERSTHAKAAFEDACTRHGLVARDTPIPDDGMSISWREVVTLGNETLHKARYHDIVVMGRDPQLSSERIQSILMQAGRPLLIAPPKPVDIIGRKIAVAWKASAEAARALVAAAPILSHAHHVSILSVSENAADDGTNRVATERLVQQLHWHGIRAEMEVRHSPSVSASKALMEMAYNHDADLFIMGAYGRSRLREFVFGGVTRDFLTECAIPVLMFR